MNINLFNSKSGQFITNFKPNFKTSKNSEGGEEWSNAFKRKGIEKINIPELKFSRINKFFFTKKRYFNLEEKLKKKIHSLKKLEKDILKKIIFYNIPVGYKRTCQVGLGVLSISNFYNFAFFNKQAKIRDIRFKKRILFKKNNIPAFITVEEIDDDISFKLLSLSLSISNTNFLKLRYSYTKVNNLREN
jgi:hypothetical protein